MLSIFLLFFLGNFEGISVVFLEIFHDRLDWYFFDCILLWEILVVIEIFGESFLLFFPFFFLCMSFLCMSYLIIGVE